VRTSETLHLRTSNRSLRADQLATWVNRVLDGDAEGAACLRITERFPIFLSRYLDETRMKLSEQGIGANRYGLVGSSGAARLRAEGLEPSSAFQTINGSIGIWQKRQMCARAFDVRSLRRSLRFRDWNWIGSVFAGVGISFGVNLKAGNCGRCGPDGKPSGVESRAMRRKLIEEMHTASY
jgi:hypothetical protein